MVLGITAKSVLRIDYADYPFLYDSDLDSNPSNLSSEILSSDAEHTMLSDDTDEETSGDIVEITGEFAEGLELE